ncbi:hypothetical protein [Mariniblastus fucicola]|uniref:Uncharacterized protein n=1 Tax=Mariniblastus fucicola TaxID=980251 RepID=A0A5B9PEG2_9BACT|nr:hypothetical protein [Mariniblastus fucicola]QEG23889.1 hypothetical protein MFFC18_37930 [Mariniblastus fucicola]
MNRRATGRRPNSYNACRPRVYFGNAPELIQPNGLNSSPEPAVLLEGQEDLQAKVAALEAYASEQKFDFTDADLSVLDFEKIGPFDGEVSDELIEQLVEEDIVTD